jgi:signal peptidase I
MTMVLGVLMVVVAPQTSAASSSSEEYQCQATGATLSVAMAAFSAQNPHLTPTEPLLLSHAHGGPYLASWPTPNKHFNYSIVAGKLMVSIPASAKAKLFGGPNVCSALKRKTSGESTTTTLSSTGSLTFHIESESMTPTLKAGESVSVTPLNQGTPIHIGDILIFKAPPKVGSECGDDSRDLVSRVVGVPGDHLSSKGNTILINGTALTQTWSHSEPLGKAIAPVVVDGSHYFVMGDNQSDSCDSRYWGTLSRSKVVGIVKLPS